MTCTMLLTRIEMLVEGTLPANEQEAAAEHLATCPRCREIVEVMRTDLGFMVPEPPTGFAESVLDRTSGRPCDAARARLGGLVDGSFERLERELVESHLNGCRDCTALVGALTRLTEDLPVFATLRPVPSLVEAVIEATVPQRPSSSWRDAWSATWQSLLGRSRFALEAGYVGAVLLWLLFGASWAPLRAAPAQALAVVQENHVGTAVDAMSSSLTRNAGDAWNRFWSNVSQSVSQSERRDPEP